jgi:hypothetical protein
MKTYSLENVNYSFNRNSRKWHFVAGKTQFILSCPGGKATADAVVKQIVASCKRTKQEKIDGIARKAIDKLTNTVSVDE